MVIRPMVTVGMMTTMMVSPMCRCCSSLVPTEAKFSTGFQPDCSTESRRAQILRILWDQILHGLFRGDFDLKVLQTGVWEDLIYQHRRCSRSHNISSQVPRPTCWWKWVGRTKGVKSGISTLTVNISAKCQCFHQSGAFFGTAHAWIFRIRWENEKKFTNIVAGAPRVSSPSFARFFPQFRQDLFGFVTYGFLTVHLSDLFHLSIRSVLQLRNVVLMCISSLIKPQINLICGLFNHTVALCWILFLSIFLQF